MTDSNPYDFELRASTRADEGPHQLLVKRGISMNITDHGLNELFELQRVVNEYLLQVAPNLTLIVGKLEADHVMKVWAAQGRPSHPFAGTEGEQYCRRCAGGRDGIQHPGDQS